VLFDGTAFKISAIIPSELWGFQYFVPAGAPSVPTSAIAPNFSAQLLLFDGTALKIIVKFSTGQ